MVFGGCKMIAFKTYAECPPSIKPQGIPDCMVWELHEVGENFKEEYEELGYSVLTTDEYFTYLSSIANTEQTYLNSVNQIKAITDLDNKITNILATNQSEGLKLIIEFGKRNMLLGKTEDQIDMIMEDLDVIKLCLALISGSYKYALRKASKLSNTAITESDKQYFIDRITDLLTRK
jgi:hypothetical protein